MSEVAVLPVKKAKKVQIIPPKAKPLRRKLYMRTQAGKPSTHYVEVVHRVDPAVEILERFGAVPDDIVQFSRILVAVYQPPMVTTTQGGIMLTQGISEEDLNEFRYQGKVGLIVARGKQAYVDDDSVKFHGTENRVGDWVWFRPSDGIACEVNEVFCRILNERDIIGRVPHPDYIW